MVAGIEAARAAGFRSIKLNAVAVKGFNDDEVADLCRWAWQRDLVPRFIEQMPMAAGALFVPGTLLSAAEIRRLVETAFAPARLVAATARRARWAPARPATGAWTAGGDADAAGPRRWWASSRR